MRALATLADLPRTDFLEALDFSLAYFVWCHSLREWLIKDNAVGQDVIDSALSAYLEWKIVRDLANRSRHLVITQNPTDPDWAVFREYDPFAPHLEGRERHHVVLLFEGRQHRVTELVRTTGQMWECVLVKLELKN
jgi:hypothetical protein